jgi:hypothetical protein
VNWVQLDPDRIEKQSLVDTVKSFGIRKMLVISLSSEQESTF